MEEVFALLPWENEIQQTGRVDCPIQKLLIIIRNHIDDPLFIILFAHEEGKPLGFCIALISKLPDKRIHIIRMYAPNIVGEFITELKNLGKEYGIRKISLTINKNMKAIERKYGFEIISTNMEMSLI